MTLDREDKEWIIGAIELFLLRLNGEGHDYGAVSNTATDLHFRTHEIDQRMKDKKDA